MGNKEKLLWAAALFAATLSSCSDVPPVDGTTPTPTLPPTPEYDPTITPLPRITHETSLTPELESQNQNQQSAPTPTAISRIDDGQNTENRNTPKYRTVNWDSLSLNDKYNVHNWDKLILENANRFDIDPKVIAVVIDTESHGRTDGIWAENPGDGVGLMGVMPQELGFPNRPTREELFDPETNIRWGTSILWEIHHNPNMGNGNWYDTLLWYNAGLPETLHYAIPYADNAYNKLGWVIPSQETNESSESYLE